VVVGAGAGDRVAVGNGPAGAAVDKECTSHQFLPKRGRFETKNCKNREKNAKNARKLLQKTHKQCQNRQIVENGVDQIWLQLATSGNEKKRKNSFSLFFARDLAYFRAVFLV
jgi:hypothetical protein